MDKLAEQVLVAFVFKLRDGPFLLALARRLKRSLTKLTVVSRLLHANPVLFMHALSEVLLQQHGFKCAPVLNCPT